MQQLLTSACQESEARHLEDEKTLGVSAAGASLQCEEAHGWRELDQRAKLFRFALKLPSNEAKARFRPHVAHTLLIIAQIAHFRTCRCPAQLDAEEKADFSVMA